jgi:hypothetical protein
VNSAVGASSRPSIPETLATWSATLIAINRPAW